MGLFRFIYVRRQLYNDEALNFSQLLHYVKSVRFRSYSGQYLVRMREITDQKNSKYGHFSSSVSFILQNPWSIWTLNFFMERKFRYFYGEFCAFSSFAQNQVTEICLLCTYPNSVKTNNFFQVVLFGFIFLSLILGQRSTYAKTR